MRSLHTHLGFEPDHALLARTDLSMGGYRGDQVPGIQRRMLEAIQRIPGVKSAGLVDLPPMDVSRRTTLVFKETATDFRPANAVAEAMTYSISAEYFQEAGSALLSGRTLTWNDTPEKPRVAVVNQAFARRVFGATTNVIGRYFDRLPGDLGSDLLAVFR